MGISRPAKKKSPFHAQKSLKMPISGGKIAFWAKAVSSGPLSPILQVRDSEKSFAGYGNLKKGFSGAPQPEEGSNVSENGLKLPLLCEKCVCLPLRGSVDAPPTTFCMWQIQLNRLRSMVGIIFKDENKSAAIVLVFGIN